MKTQGSVTHLIGEAQKSTWLWVPLHQVKRIRGFTAHLAKSIPTCCDRVWVESHSGKKPVSFGHHKGSRTTCDQVLCPADDHLPGPVVSEVPLMSGPPERHPSYTRSSGQLC